MKNMNPMIKTLKNNLISLPTPSNISYSWNMGSMLSITLLIQIISGLFISMNYIPSTQMAFSSYIDMSHNLKQGFILKFLHSSSASFIFILIYTHIFRALMNNSFKNTKTWLSGNLILLSMMATAFLGYVLPWGQMSFWAATVITNLLSSIPIIGPKITLWLWGDFSINKPTLNRFYSFHFMLPMLISAMSLIHLSILHLMGSSNNMNISPNKDKIPFNKLFSIKDLTSILILLSTLTLMFTSLNLTFMDPENFTPANPMTTPNHIMPEWYFLFAYSILRSIPSKLGGVIALISSILILSILPLIKTKKSAKFNPLTKLTNYMFLSNFILLTFMGSKPIEEPFSKIMKISSSMYFLTLTI